MVEVAHRYVENIKIFITREAEVLILTKDKRLTDKYKISFENVKEAYPDIQWGGRS